MRLLGFSVHLPTRQYAPRGQGRFESCPGRGLVVAKFAPGLEFALPSAQPSTRLAGLSDQAQRWAWPGQRSGAEGRRPPRGRHRCPGSFGRFSLCCQCLPRPFLGPQVSWAHIPWPCGVCGRMLCHAGRVGPSPRDESAFRSPRPPLPAWSGFGLAAQPGTGEHAGHHLGTPTEASRQTQGPPVSCRGCCS